MSTLIFIFVLTKQFIFDIMLNNIDFYEANMTGNNFFAILSRMKYISRWSLMRNVWRESLSEHSLDVAIVAHALAIIKNKRFNGTINAERVAILAMYHDVSEILTGDLPTPVKYFNPEIKTAYKQVEKSATDKIFSMLPDDLKPDFESILYKHPEDEYNFKIVKAADKICGLIKCMEEESCGNNEFKQALRSHVDAIKEMQMPEVKEFMTEFFPQYSKTLDEQ